MKRRNFLKTLLGGVAAAAVMVVLSVHGAGAPSLTWKATKRWPFHKHPLLGDFYIGYVMRERSDGAKFATSIKLSSDEPSTERQQQEYTAAEKRLDAFLTCGCQHTVPCAAHILTVHPATNGAALTHTH